MCNFFTNNNHSFSILFQDLSFSFVLNPTLTVETPPPPPPPHTHTHTLTCDVKIAILLGLS